MKIATTAVALALGLGLAPMTAAAEGMDNAASATGQQNASQAAFGTYDEDGDGTLSEEEYAAVGDSFGDYDADQSGSIDQAEYDAWSDDTFGDAANSQQTASLYDTWDGDGDGQLTESEFGADDTFNDWDENDSGALEEDEGWF